MPVAVRATRTEAAEVASESLTVLYAWWTSARKAATMWERVERDGSRS